MKRTVSLILMLCLLAAHPLIPHAEQPQQNAVSELYSADGAYTDGVGNRSTYSYHVPQIHANTPAAEELNAEIAGKFGERAEAQLRNMEKGVSLWSGQIGWEAYWNDSQVFLLITADADSDRTEYGAYGYDFSSGKRVTNDMILEQKGISKEQYLEKLRDSVSELFEELYVPIPEGVETDLSHDSLLEDTLGWLSADQPIFLDGNGEIETWVEIASPAGAGKYSHLIAPFSISTDDFFDINVTGDTYLIESCPKAARPGETVTIMTYDVTDGDKQIKVSGVEVTSIDWFEYQFVMPEHDVEVEVAFIGNGLA